MPGERRALYHSQGYVIIVLLLTTTAEPPRGGRPHGSTDERAALSPPIFSGTRERVVVWRYGDFQPVVPQVAGTRRRSQPVTAELLQGSRCMRRCMVDVLSRCSS